MKSTRAKKVMHPSNNDLNGAVDAEKSDRVRRDISEMVTSVSAGIQDSGVDVESHVYLTLQKHGIKSGLFDQLHYNHHYRVKQALGDHDYLKTELLESKLLQRKYTNSKDVWHDPLISSTNAKADDDDTDEEMQAITVDKDTEGGQ